MVTKKNLVIGFAALLLMTVMNLYHVLGDYGFVDGSLCQNILAQSSSSSGGGGSSSSGGGGSSSSGGGSSSSSNKGTNTNEPPKINYAVAVSVSEPFDEVIDGKIYSCATAKKYCTRELVNDNGGFSCGQPVYHKECKLVK